MYWDIVKVRNWFGN